MRRLAFVVGLGLVSVFLGSSDALAQFGSVQGRVLDAEGKPLPDASVVLQAQEKPLTFKSKTNKKGEFRQITSQTSGPWQITISKDGYTTWETTTRITLGEATLNLPPVTLTRSGPTAEERKVVEGKSQRFKEATTLLIAADGALQAGDAAGAQVKLSAAEAAFLAIAQEEPTNSKAHFNLALVYDRKQDWDKASATYLKAAELEPEMADATVGAAAALINSRQPGKAVEVIEGALARHPDHARLQSLKGLALYNEGRYADAAPLFEKVRQSKPEDPEPYYYLGMIAVAENRASDALTLLQRYVAMQPRDTANLSAAQALIEALKKRE